MTTINRQAIEINRATWDGMPKEQKRVHKNGDRFIRVRKSAKYMNTEGCEWIQVFWRK